MDAGAEQISFGDYRLLPDQRLLLGEGGPVPLGGRAFDLLLALVERRRSVVSKDELMRLVWRNQVVEENTLAVHLSALRKALGRGLRDDRYIGTVPGRGYKFLAPVETSAGQAQTGWPGRSAVGNLPRSEGPVFGRDAALASIVAAVQTGWLVTLTGPGGIGKTRLALAAGEQLGPTFPEGIWWIDLAPIGDSAMVAGTVARVLELRLGDAPPLPRLAAALKGRRQLLILDNCEHVAAGVAALAVALTEATGMHLLVTSQEPLAVAGERVERLEPLAVPAPDTRDPAEALQSPAVQLFEARARAAAQDFVIDAGNAAAVVQLCRRFEGVPLAIELAAARAALLGPEPVARRLDAWLLELSGSRRDALPKHQTLRALLDWSHSLLTEAEKIVLRRLAVFLGGCTLDAAEAVAADRLVPEWQVAEHVASLIGKSLVIAERTGQGARYRLLETTRVYAAERLGASGEGETIAGRHAAYIGELLESAVASWEATPDTEWIARYGPEIDNIRAALAWTLAMPSRAPQAAALAGSTALYWATLGLHGEGRRYIDQAMALADDTVAPTHKARLLLRAALLRLNSDRPQALQFAEQAAAIYRQTGDETGQAQADSIIGTIFINLGRNDEAKALLTAAHDAPPFADRPKSRGNIANSLGILCGMTTRFDEAQHWFRRAVDFAQATGYAGLESLALLNLAEAEFASDAVEAAVERTRAAIPGIRAGNRRDLLALALNNLTLYFLRLDAVDAAIPAAMEAFALLRDEGGHFLVTCLENWVALGAASGRFREAARLLGFVDAAFARAGEVRELMPQRRYAVLIERLGAELTPDGRDAALAEGGLWTESQAAAYAADHLILPFSLERAEASATP